MQGTSRLKGLRVYLSGPCEHAKDAGGGWRTEILPKLKDLGLVVYDPVNMPGKLSFIDVKEKQFKYVKDLRDEGKFTELEKCMKEVVHLDLRFVDSADVLIVQLDVNSPTTGTIDEIITACNQRKPVYVCSKQGIKSIPLWLFGRIPLRYMFESLDEILKELSNIAYSDANVDCKRWLFVNNLGL